MFTNITTTCETTQKQNTSINTPTRKHTHTRNKHYIYKLMKTHTQSLKIAINIYADTHTNTNAYLKILHQTVNTRKLKQDAYTRTYKHINVQNNMPEVFLRKTYTTISTPTQQPSRIYTR